VADRTHAALDGQSHVDDQDGFARTVGRDGPHLWAHPFGSDALDWLLNVIVSDDDAFVRRLRR